MNGQNVTVIAQEKGKKLKDKVKRNFGSPLPDGYRKALRLMKQAEKFGRPIICLVDTQGHFVVLKQKKEVKVKPLLETSMRCQPSLFQLSL